MLKLREKSFLYNKSHPLFIKKSKVEGKGLFNSRPIRQGAIILKLTGKIINHDYNPEFSKIGSNWIGVGDRKWIVSEPGSVLMYLNHSCQPNVIINAEQHLVSLQAINAGEELLLDYSTTELDPFWQMLCYCGVRNCRKIIRSFQYLPANLKEKYKPLLPPDFSIEN